MTLGHHLVASNIVRAKSFKVFVSPLDLFFFFCLFGSSFSMFFNDFSNAHTVVVVFFVIAIFTGVFWRGHGVIYAYTALCVIILIVCGSGFIYFGIVILYYSNQSCFVPCIKKGLGRNIIAALRKSKNETQPSTPITKKVSHSNKIWNQINKKIYRLSFLL